MKHNVQPKVVALTNENPAWPDLDKHYADEMWQLLIEGLEQEGYTFRAFKFFDSLDFLDDFDPHEWLIWNWGEEWKGEAWSDAAVAEEIERRGFAYTGATPAVMRRTQNRFAVKQCLRAAGLPTLPATVFAHRDPVTSWKYYPAIVKGVNQHASVGIDREAVVSNADELARRVTHLHERFADQALVEPFLDTREFQVAVWGNACPEALPPSEIVYTMFTEMRDRLHTQSWKIDRESRGYKEIRMPCPAPLDRPDWRARLEDVAVQAYRVTGQRDFARFDLRMLEDEPQILDVNPNPELDPLSVVLAGAKAKGMTYGQMVSQIIQFAAVRMPRKPRIGVSRRRVRKGFAGSRRSRIP
jgi:D-alanine-D-alanine ligase